MLKIWNISLSHTHVRRLIRAPAAGASCSGEGSGAWLRQQMHPLATLARSQLIEEPAKLFPILVLPPNKHHSSTAKTGEARNGQADKRCRRERIPGKWNVDIVMALPAIM